MGVMHVQNMQRIIRAVGTMSLASSQCHIFFQLGGPQPATQHRQSPQEGIWEHTKKAAQRGQTKFKKSKYSNKLMKFLQKKCKND